MFEGRAEDDRHFFVVAVVVVVGWFVTTVVSMCLSPAPEMQSIYIFVRASFNDASAF